MGEGQEVRGRVIVVADTGPVLHLHWVGAASWALPQQPIHVVREVWGEVERHAPEALLDARLVLVQGPVPLSPLVLSTPLDAGEKAALSYALSRRGEEVLVLCDETSARMLCRRLQLQVTGSIGLILEAAHAKRVKREYALQALEELPRHGRLHVSREVIQRAIDALSGS